MYTTSTTQGWVVAGGVAMSVKTQIPTFRDWTMTVCAYLVLERTFAEPHKSYPKFPCLINDHRSTACGFCVPSIWLLAHVALVSATGLKRNSQTSSGCCLGWEGSHFLCVLANAGLGVYAQKLYRPHGWCWLW